MYDIERELREIKPKNHTQTEAFRQQTLAILRDKAQKRLVRRKLVFSLSAVVFAFFAIVVVMLPVFSSVSYYTLDINPSVQFTVNSNNTVMDVSSANDDAATLLYETELKGMRIKDALQHVIELAYTKKYLAPGGHVLVAHFGNDKGISEVDLKEMVDNITPGIKVLLLKGEKSSYEEAQYQDIQAGIRLLKEQASDKGIAEIDVDNIISLMCSEKDEQVPVGNANSDSVGCFEDDIANIDDGTEEQSLGLDKVNGKKQDKGDKETNQEKEAQTDKEANPEKVVMPDKEAQPNKTDKPYKKDKPGQNDKLHKGDDFKDINEDDFNEDDFDEDDFDEDDPYEDDFDEDDFDGYDPYEDSFDEDDYDEDDSDEDDSDEDDFNEDDVDEDDVDEDDVDEDDVDEDDYYEDDFDDVSFNEDGYDENEFDNYEDKTQGCAKDK